MKFGLFVVAFGTIFLSGCATILQGNTQAVTVQTEPVGATCTLTNDEGSWVALKTPDSVTVDRDCDPMTIICELDEHHKIISKHNSKFTGATIGNIFLGGGIGLIVDAASGSNCEYKSIVKIKLQPKKINLKDPTRKSIETKHSSIKNL